MGSEMCIRDRGNKDNRVIVMSPTSIKVLIADDHPVVRLGLKTMIDYESDLELVGEASNGEEAIKLFRQYQPDVALIDLRMPIIDGVEAISVIIHEFPKAQIIILTTYDGDEDYLSWFTGRSKKLFTQKHFIRRTISNY